MVRNLDVAPFFSRQVLRESRLRRAAPGEEWSTRERDDNEVQTIMLLRKGETKKDPEWKRLAVQLHDEHLASWDFLAALISAIEDMCQVHIDWYYVEGPLPVDSVPRALFLTMDFQQTQWRVAWFLRLYVSNDWGC